MSAELRRSGILAFAAMSLVAVVSFAAHAQTLTPAAGCGPDAATDPKPLEHKVARCAANSPPPMPLPAKTVVKLASLSTKIENFLPIAIGLAKGEFLKENIDLQIENMPSSDAFQLMAQDKIDMAWTSPDGGFLNATNQGFDLVWALANYSAAPNSKTGLWVKKGVAPADLKGKIIGTVVGPGSITMYPQGIAFAKGGFTAGDIVLQRFDVQGTVLALENGAVQGAWLLDPVWTKFANDPNYVFMQGQPLGEPLGGVIYGPTMRKNRAAGVGFARAMARIYNTYLDGDYKADPVKVKEMAAILGVPETSLTAVPSNIWDWEIRDGTMTRIQDAVLLTKALMYTKPQPEAKLVDRSFYQEAIGRKM